MKIFLLLIREREREREPHNGRRNLLLEGDNYIWLKVLEQTHRGKIDVIYIDPPYNTGNKDFKYNDKFIDPNDIFRHSKWLDFMYKRLLVARDLLANDGLFFVSCDDHAQAQLKMLCDEVFGAERYIGMFKWNKTSKAPTLSKFIRNKYEYVLAYRRDSRSYLRGPDSYNTTAGLYNKTNKLNTIVFPAGAIDCAFDDGTYSKGSYTKGDITVELIDDLIVKDGVNATPCIITARFKWVQSTVDERIVQGQRFLFKTPTFTTMYYYLDPTGNFIAPSDILNREECGVLRNDEAYNELAKIFGRENVFDYSKPVSLISYLIHMSNKDDAVILDFFAGSGTTAQAVEELNAEDGGHRQWILVTNNEDQDKDDGDSETGICRDITKPRIDTIITGIRPDGSKYSDGTDSAYDYYQYGFINRTDKRKQNERTFQKTKILGPLVAIKHGARKIATDMEKKALVYDNGEELVILSVGTPTQQDINDIAQAQGLGERNIIAVVPDESPIALDEIVEGITVVPFSKMTDREYLGERK